MGKIRRGLVYLLIGIGCLYIGIIFVLAGVVIVALHPFGVFGLCFILVGYTANVWWASGLGIALIIIAAYDHYELIFKPKHDTDIRFST